MLYSNCFIQIVFFFFLLCLKLIIKMEMIHWYIRWFKHLIDQTKPRMKQVKMTNDLMSIYQNQMFILQSYESIRTWTNLSFWKMVFFFIFFVLFFFSNFFSFHLACLKCICLTKPWHYLLFKFEINLRPKLITNMNFKYWFFPYIVILYFASIFHLFHSFIFEITLIIKWNTLKNIKKRFLINVNYKNSNN